MKSIARISLFTAAIVGSLALTSCFHRSAGRDSLPPYWSQPGLDMYGHRFGDEARPHRSFRKVVVQHGYHFESGNGSPVKHDARDVDWVGNQSPTDYTIEVGSDEKPAVVAKRLFQAPKTQRAAQFKGRDNKYTGVYGTYKSREDAEKAMRSLPEDVRKSSRVTDWGDVQKSAPAKAASTPAQAAPADSSGQ